jgi:hypothetical protein
MTTPTIQPIPRPQNMDYEVGLYLAELPYLRINHDNQWIAIQGNVTMFYDTYEAAHELGMAHFGSQHFLIKKISAAEEAAHIDLDSYPTSGGRLILTCQKCGATITGIYLQENSEIASVVLKDDFGKEYVEIRCATCRHLNKTWDRLPIATIKRLLTN